MAMTDVKEVFSKLAESFDASASQGVDAVFQFDITGDGGGTWNVMVRDRTCQIQEGSHDSPAVTLSMSSDTWLGIVNKVTDAMGAFISGQLKVSGNIMLAQRIPKLFGF